MIEFFWTPWNTRLVVHEIEANPFEPFTSENLILAKEVDRTVRLQFPDTYANLCRLYSDSPAMVYPRANRFLKCNFSVYDNQPDIDSDGFFNVETVPCPMRGECKDGICNPKNTVELSAREQSIIRLHVEGFSQDQIGDRLFISPNTVHSHITNIYRKLGFTGQPHPDFLLISYAYKNHLV